MPTIKLRATWCRMLQCCAVCYSVLQCVAVSCNVLQSGHMELHILMESACQVPEDALSIHELICINVYIYIHVCIHINMHMYACYIYIYMYAYKNVCITCVFVCSVCTYTCMHVSVYFCIFSWMKLPQEEALYTYIYICMYI